MTDGSDSDFWLMACGYITNVFMEDVMISSITHHLSPLCPTRPFVPCGVRKQDGTKRPGLLSTTTKHPAFTAQGQRSLFSQHHGGAVVMLSRHLCFLHWVRCRVSPSSSVWWNCDAIRTLEFQFRTTRNSEGSLRT